MYILSKADVKSRNPFSSQKKKTHVRRDWLQHSHSILHAKKTDMLSKISESFALYSAHTENVHVE